MKHAAKAGARPAAKPAPTIYELTPEIKPNQSIELLKELHILTRDGKINQDSRRKLKQVNHLLQFIEPLLAEVAKYGVASVKRIYGDWTKPNLGSWKKVLLDHSIQPIQQFAYSKGKNEGIDIAAAAGTTVRAAGSGTVARTR